MIASPAFPNLSSRIARKIRHIRDRKILLKNRDLHGIHKGKRCFIIGNGPSIKQQDLLRLRDEMTFVANSFFRHENYNLIHPKFYIIIDSSHFKGDDSSHTFFTELGSKIHEDTIVFLPLKAKNFIEKNGYLPKNTRRYIYIRGEFKENRHNNIDIDRTIPTPMGAGLMALILAEYMGFKTSYLLGFDHDWLSRRIEQPIGRFYATHIFNDDSEDTYEYRMWCQYILFRGYRLLSKQMKSKVFNLTPGSFLDVFPSQNYEEVLSV